MKEIDQDNFMELVNVFKMIGMCNAIIFFILVFPIFNIAETVFIYFNLTEIKEVLFLSWFFRSAFVIVCCGAFLYYDKKIKHFFEELQK